MSDTNIICKQRKEEPQNLYVNDRVYQGLDTGPKMNFQLFFLFTKVMDIENLITTDKILK